MNHRSKPSCDSSETIAGRDRAGAEGPSRPWLPRLAAALRADRQRGAGPQVQQTSNAYRLSLPARALRFLGRLGMASPPPDDHSHAQEQHAEEIKAHQDSLPLDELPLFTIGDNPLGRALANLGKAMKQRESARQTKCPSNFLSKSEN